MATLKALQEKIAKLQAQAETIAKRESSAVFGKIRDLMEKHGLTPDDIAAHFRKPTTGRKTAATRKSSAHAGAVKYLDPKTGATWTGHGRAPAWIADAKNRSKFLVEGASTAPAVAKKTPKSGNYVRGPQKPLYRDPMSGATWSGRGRAPAWLATAKDRTEYLIEAGAASAKKAATNVAVKKAGAKKTAASKKARTVKSAVKQSAAKTAPTAKKSARATKKVGAKKASVKRAPLKKVAAKKAVAIDVSTPAAEQGVTNGAASA